MLLSMLLSQGSLLGTVSTSEQSDKVSSAVWYSTMQRGVSWHSTVQLSSGQHAVHHCVICHIIITECAQNVQYNTVHSAVRSQQQHI